MQDTSHQLFTESVMDEVLLSMDNEDETVADFLICWNIKTGTRNSTASIVITGRSLCLTNQPAGCSKMREVARSLSHADQGHIMAGKYVSIVRQ